MVEAGNHFKVDCTSILYVLEVFEHPSMVVYGESHKDVMPPSTVIHVGSYSRTYIWGCFLMTFSKPLATMLGYETL